MRCQCHHLHLPIASSRCEDNVISNNSTTAIWKRGAVSTPSLSSSSPKMKMTASSKPAALAITPKPHEVERMTNDNDDDAVNKNNNNTSSARRCTPNGITPINPMGETDNNKKQWMIRG